MPIEKMTDEELSLTHREFLVKAYAARAEGDLDLAQRYLTFIRPMNAEMSRRMGRV